MAKKKNKTKSKNKEIVYGPYDLDRFLNDYIKAYKKDKTFHAKTPSLTQIVKGVDVCSIPEEEISDKYGHDLEKFSSVNGILTKAIEESREATETEFMTELVFESPFMIDISIYVKHIKFKNMLAFVFYNRNNANVTYGTVFIDFKDKKLHAVNMHEKIDLTMVSGTAGYILYSLDFLVENFKGFIMEGLRGVNQFITLKTRGFSRELIDEIKNTVESKDFYTDEMLIEEIDKVEKNNIKQYVTGALIHLPQNLNSLDSVIISSRIIIDYLNDKNPSKILKDYNDLPDYFTEMVFTTDSNKHEDGFDFKYVVKRKEEYSFIKGIVTLGEEQRVIPLIVIKTLEDSVSATFFLNREKETDPFYKVFMQFNGEKADSMKESLINEIMAAIICTYKKLEEYRKNKAKERENTIIVEKTNPRIVSHAVKEIALTKEEEPRENFIRRKYNVTELEKIGIKIKFKELGIRKTFNKRPMRRHTVHGFWRHYKSGKKVWISEFKRGKGEEIKKELIIE